MDFNFVIYFSLGLKSDLALWRKGKMGEAASDLALWRKGKMGEAAMGEAAMGEAAVRHGEGTVENGWQYVGPKKWHALVHSILLALEFTWQSSRG
jgi:hypothetical protein